MSRPPAPRGAGPWSRAGEQGRGAGPGSRGDVPVEEGRALQVDSCVTGEVHLEFSKFENDLRGEVIP